MNSQSPQWLRVEHHSRKRAIEDLWNEAREAIYGTTFKTPNQESEIDKEMQCINLAYAKAKEKFEWDLRDTGERYFEHLRETAYILIRKEFWKAPSIFQIVVAILHDVMEDKNVSKSSIEDLFSDIVVWKRWENFPQRVSRAVELVSKKDWKEYIHSSLDRAFIESYDDETKHDTNWFPLKVKRRKQDKKNYEKIKQEAKRLRNIDYYSQIYHAEDTEVIDVKLADRLHNLRTQWNPKKKKQVVRKVRETKEFILPIAKKHNPEAYRLLSAEIEKLESQLWYTVEVQEEIDFTKSYVDYILTEK